MNNINDSINDDLQLISNEFDRDDDRDYQLDNISSDDETVNLDTLKYLITCLQKNTFDNELIINIIQLLQKANYQNLAFHVTKIAIDLYPNDISFNYYLNQLPSSFNSSLYNTLYNTWFKQPIYIFQDYLTLKEINQSSSFNHKNQPIQQTDLSKDLDLNLLENKFLEIPSLQDSVWFIPPGKDFHIFRKFTLKKFTLYQLNLKYTISPKIIDTTLIVNTTDQVSRFNYKLPQAQIQYKFNSLNMDSIHLGVKGINNDTNIGQIRISNLSLTEISFSINLNSNKIIRTLSPTIPIYVTMLINSTEEILGIQNCIESIINFVDFINIYFNIEQLRIPDFLNHNSKFNIFQNRSFSTSKKGYFHWTDNLVGYHLLIDPTLIYHPDYVPLLISKIQQYNHRVCVGLEGIQIQSSNYQNYISSRKCISANMSINQDIKCHILGLNTFGYFTGSFYIKPSSIDDKLLSNTNSDTYDILVAGFGQEQKIPFICIERFDQLVKPNHKIINKVDNTKIIKINEDLINKYKSWNFY